MEPSPAATYDEKPAVIIWYKVYMGLMALFSLTPLAAGIFLFVGPVTTADMDGMAPEILGIVYIVIGVVFMIPIFAAFFLPRKPWVWVYHLVMICLGLPSCMVVFCVPLLIFWLKPEVKTYFGQESA